MILLKVIKAGETKASVLSLTDDGRPVIKGASDPAYKALLSGPVANEAGVLVNQAEGMAYMKAVAAKLKKDGYQVSNPVTK